MGAGEKPAPDTKTVLGASAPSLEPNQTRSPQQQRAEPEGLQSAMLLQAPRAACLNASYDNTLIGMYSFIIMSYYSSSLGHIAHYKAKHKV